ncbi:hypothetical protein IJ732_02330 [bacterium]|nr:hypothetical protein [bacterium]
MIKILYYCMMSKNSYSNISFGLNNPQAALHRAQKIKEKYAQKGLKYLLPNEVLTDKQIEEKLQTVNKYIRYFIEKGTMVEETVQYAINNVMPKEAKDSILVKDISKLEESMRAKNYSQETINKFKNIAGLTVPPNGKGTPIEIFVKFAYAKGSKEDKNFLAETTIHELQHAFKRNFQNIFSSQRYKQLNTPIEEQVPASLFHQFESKFYPYFNYSAKPKEFTDKQFYKELGINSSYELYQKFAAALEEVEQECSGSPQKFLKDKFFGKYTKKYFFEALKNSANDEKKSFEIESKIKNPEDYTLFEFFPKLYSEMAKYFSNLKKFAHD